jgi:phosphopantetheine--protein transferase-like protein
MIDDGFGDIRIQVSSFLQSLQDDFGNLNLGFWLLSVTDFAKMLKREGPDGLFSLEEIEHSRSRLDSLAGRYAGKLAAREALGKEIGLRELLILSSSNREPIFSFSKEDLHKHVYLSITHEDDLAASVAACLANNSQFGIGIDVTRVERISKVLKDQPNVLPRIFTEREISEMKNMPDDAALKWVGKEAVSKALGIGIWHGASLREVEILTSGTEPMVLLAGRWLERAREKRLRKWKAGFMMNGKFVMAVVLAI